jgi:hypothetical protein
MRADIHDGPEHKPLQTEAGYIDARPQRRQIDENSCDARPDHTSGSVSDTRACPRRRQLSPKAAMAQPRSAGSHGLPAIVRDGWWSRGSAPGPWPFPHRMGWGLWRIWPDSFCSQGRPPISRGGGVRRVGGLVLDRAGSPYRKPQSVHVEAAITINGETTAPGSAYGE